MSSKLVMLDSAGRLQIPKEIRERYNIGDRIRMEETPEGLMLRPVASAAPAIKRLAGPDEPPPEKPRGIKKWMNLLQRRR